MKAAILSESPADEAALRVLVQAVVAGPAGFVAPAYRARGWPSVEQVLPAVLRFLHFQTDADGLVVVVDSDDSLVHRPDHDRPGYFNPNCRMCRLRQVTHRTLRHLPLTAGRARVLRAVGIAVPAVEGWYLCGLDPAVTEEAWVRGQGSGRPPYTRAELKRRVYGTDRPSLPLETTRAVEQARRHAADTRRLEFDFPGFAALARDLRGWAQEDRP